MKEQATAASPAGKLDARGRMVGAEQERQSLLSPLYIPFPGLPMSPGDKWDDSRLFQDGNISVTYKLLPSKSPREFQIEQSFKERGNESLPGSVTVFDVKRGMPIRGRLRYTQDDHGAKLTIDYQVTPMTRK
jgi:hypothetical protein